METSDRHDRPELLVLRALKLGDLLVSVPALRALRRAFPGHRFTYAGPAWLTPLIDLIGGIDTVLATPSLDEPLAVEPGRVDIAVNLHGGGPQSRGRLEEIKPRRRIGHQAPGWDGPLWQEDLHERNRWTRLLEWNGIAADPLDYRLTIPQAVDSADVGPAVSTGAAAGARPGAAGAPGTTAGARPDAAGIVVVHVGAAYGSRLWPVDRFAETARVLAGSGHTVIFTGSQDERPRALEVAELAGLDEITVVAGQLSLGGFATRISSASLVISADTGAAHLATAFGRPSVVLFGPAPVARWGPPPGPHIVLTDERQRIGEIFSEEPDPALLAITPADVLAAASELGVR